MGLGIGVTALGAGVPNVRADGEEWSIVAMPDTQKYVEREGRVSYVQDQTEWVAENADTENIVFVSHVGDMVENGDRTVEWDRIDSAMSTLDGVVPYSVTNGNHDWAVLWDRSSSFENYTSYFGQSRFEDQDWFGGTGPSEASSYQLFSAGGYDFLHLALEWEPPGDVDDAETALGWGQSIMDQYPDRPTILTTHSYIRDDTEDYVTRLQEGRGTDDPPNGNTGETVWEEFVSQNSQIFMVLCGHWHEVDGEYHQVSTNEDGEAVYEMLSNYQDLANGGNGWMRQITFQKGGGSEAPDRIQVETYSPSLDESMTNSDSEFAFDLDFDARFTGQSSGGEPSSDPDADATFEQGVDGYAGTVDTNVREANPSTSYGDVNPVTVDTNEPQGSENTAQALLRFDGIIGSEDGQIPLGATIDDATLTLETVDEGSGGALHRMLTDWDESATWDSLDGGIQADNNDALASADVETGTVGLGTTTIDVSATVQSWANGDANYGWAVLPLGDDGWDFETAEGSSPPTLTVNFQEPDGSSEVAIEGDVDGDGDVDEDDLELVQRDIANYDVDIDRQAADMNDDGDVDIGDALAIDRKIGGGQ